MDDDTKMKLWINGKEVDAEEHVLYMKRGSFEWKSKDGNVMVIDIDDIYGYKSHLKVKKKKNYKKESDDS